MYKRMLGLIVYILIFATIFSLFVVAQEPPPSSPTQSSMADVVNTVMQRAQKDMIEGINRNMDDNIKILDERIMSTNRSLTNKNIIALTGSMTILLFGYAFVTNRITKRYDMNFYEKMVDSKIEKLGGMTGKIVEGSDSFYHPITHSQFSPKYISPEDYFDKHFNVDESEFGKLKSEVASMRRAIGEKDDGNGEGFFGYVGISGKAHKATTPVVPEKKRWYKPNINKKILYAVIGVLLILVALYFVYRFLNASGIISSINITKEVA
jgi:hypothetical protein